MTTAEPRSKLWTWLIGLTLGPVVLMLWLGRGRLALAYLLVQIIAFGLIFVAVTSDLIAPPAITDIALFGFLYSQSLNIIGTVHGLRIRAVALQRPWFSRWYAAILLPFAAFLLPAVIMRNLLFQPFSTPSANMLPGLMIGDYFFVSKIASGEPRRGDIIVFQHPRDNITYVMRLIGLPGDRIQMKYGVVHLNGEALPLTPVEGISCLEGERCDFLRETLPDGRSYVINNAEPNGIADNTDEYVVPEGCYFMLGDNRDNALDSRFADQIGYIPRENLIGPAALIYWNSFGFRIDDRLKGYPTK